MDDRPKLQHTGRELDSLNFTILLKEFPGARESVDTRINKLLEMANAGNDQDVVFGAKYYGRWVIQSISVDHKEFHFGVTLSAKMNLKLTEYN
jgi:phage protein U